MVWARSRSRVDSRPWPLWTVVACCLAVSTGCTMCPDPFDYSGPVPNGTPPQNDFRARSNGILPLGAAPRPWPTVVKNAVPDALDPLSESDEQAADSAGGPEATEADASALRQTSVMVGETPPSDEAGPFVSAGSGPPPELQPVPPVIELPLGCVPAAEHRVAAPFVMPPPAAGETPGWRTRR